jgi:hypothetical protein
VVSHGQNRGALFVKAVEKRILKIWQHAFPYAGFDFNGRFWELGNESFGLFHFGKKSASEPRAP